MPAYALPQETIDRCYSNFLVATHRYEEAIAFLFIRRDFIGAKGMAEGAKEEWAVAACLQAFIGDAIVVGHNILEFDEPRLRAMKVVLKTARHIISSGQVPTQELSTVQDIVNRLGLRSPPVSRVRMSLRRMEDHRWTSLTKALM